VDSRPVCDPRWQREGPPENPQKAEPDRKIAPKKKQKKHASSPSGFHRN
jgi:hypothetical protein